jgi:hypothetical protein
MTTQHVTNISLWHNNHKGTDHMWVMPSDIGLENGIPADNYPEYMQISGKHGAVFTWRRSGVVSKFIDNSERRCLEYECDENPHELRPSVYEIKLYLILSS